MKRTWTVTMSDAPPLNQIVSKPRCTQERLWSKMDMVRSYVRAKLSGRNATPEVVEQRLESCHNCVSLCHGDGQSWCGACGCGNKRKEAIIEGSDGPSKLTFTKLYCPRHKEGFSNND